MGIEGRTPAEVFDLIADRQSQDGILAEIRDTEDQQQAGYGDYVADARDFMKSCDGPWNSDQFHGTKGPLTETELELLHGPQDVAG